MLRAYGESGSGDDYADQVKSQMASYGATETEPLLLEIRKEKSAMAAMPANLRIDQWGLAAKVLAKMPEINQLASGGDEHQSSPPDASQSDRTRTIANEQTPPDWMLSAETLPEPTSEV